MNDPIRFLDPANDAMPYERAALSAGRNIEPPPGAKDRIWAALGPHLGPDGGNGGGQHGSDGGSSSGNALSQGSSGVNSTGVSISSSVGGAKVIALGAAGISAIAGAVAAVLALTSPAPVASNMDAPAPIVTMAPPVIAEPVAPIPQTEGQPAEVLPSPQATIAAPPIAPPPHESMPTKARVSSAKPKEEKTLVVEEASAEHQERASRLREENQLLGDARAALRSGDPASAMAKLDAASSKFPDGVLAQEREVLAIESLAKSGQTQTASARASAFLAAHPTSPHATKIRSFVK